MERPFTENRFDGGFMTEASGVSAEDEEWRKTAKTLVGYQDTTTNNQTAAPSTNRSAATRVDGQP